MKTNRNDITVYVFWVFMVTLLVFVLVWPTILRWQIDRAIDKALAQELERMINETLKTPKEGR